MQGIMGEHAALLAYASSVNKNGKQEGDERLVALRGMSLCCVNGR